MSWFMEDGFIPEAGIVAYVDGVTSTERRPGPAR